MYKFATSSRLRKYAVAGLLLLLAWLFDFNAVYAQKNEVGLGIGGFNYTGDLVRDFRLQNTRPGGMLFYRRNFNEFFSARISLSGGGLFGNDTPPYDPLAQQRDTAFSISVVELAGTIEYHFLDYKENINLLRWSPYFFIGAGIAFFGPHEQKTENYSSTQPVIPFGLGFKYILNPVWNLGFEAGIRKTFFDHIDNISVEDLNNKNFAYGNLHDKDWYYFIGLSISYTFYTIPCPYLFN